MRIESIKRESINNPSVKLYEGEKSRNEHLEKELNRFKNDNNNLKKKMNDIIEMKNNSVVNDFLSSREIRVTQNNLSSMKSELNFLQNENKQLKYNLNNQCQNHLHEIENLKKINLEQSAQINDMRSQIHHMSMDLNNSQRGNESFNVLKQAYDQNYNQNLKYIETIKLLKEQLNNQNKIQINEITHVYRSNIITSK